MLSVSVRTTGSPPITGLETVIEMSIDLMLFGVATGAARMVVWSQARYVSVNADT
jgi:hypothetical protein